MTDDSHFRKWIMIGLGSMIACVFCQTYSLLGVKQDICDLQKEIAIVKTVLIVKGIMPVDLEKDYHP